MLELGTLKRPVPTATQILIRVFAASLNPGMDEQRSLGAVIFWLAVDFKTIQGKLKLLSPLVFPWIPSFDVAGVVEVIGANVSGFKVGDPVFARVNRQCSGVHAIDYCCS